MSQAIVRKALEQRLATWAAAKSPALPIAYQNVAFTPPDGTYLRAFLLPVQTNSQDLELKHRQYRGIWQVSLLLPNGNGSADSEALVAELEALFAPSMPIAQDGLLVYITSPMSAANAIAEDTHYAVPVSAPYRLDTSA